MEIKNIERLITDLKNLPKEKAPDNLEEKLFLKIQNLVLIKNNTKKERFSFLKYFFNPLLAPAISIVLVACFLILNFSHNSIYKPADFKEIKNFIDEKPNSVTGTLNSKKNSNKQKEIPSVEQTKPEKPPFEIGSGVTLDSQPVEMQNSNTDFIQETGYPPHPVQRNSSDTENLKDKNFKNDTKRIIKIDSVKRSSHIKTK